MACILESQLQYVEKASLRFSGPSHSRLISEPSAFLVAARSPPRDVCPISFFCLPTCRSRRLPIRCPKVGKAPATPLTHIRKHGSFSKAAPLATPETDRDCRWTMGILVWELNTDILRHACREREPTVLNASLVTETRTQCSC